MKTEFVSVVYDRKKRVNATGEGKVELYIHFSRREKKYVTIKTCNPIAWRKYQDSDELRLELVLETHSENFSERLPLSVMGGPNMIPKRKRWLLLMR